MTKKLIKVNLKKKKVKQNKTKQSNKTIEGLTISF